ncbi:winged helix-turn-helix transcriptional regulator [Bradyrhizobium diazoefficiens]|uniref:MarR family winged helix-turn-helix transcriptional regulator n=2 Tax=Bradyrhizobium TaxID=374 RepID=UPI001BAA3243|nr:MULTISPECIES: MarR family winged helix-turn-helix transcriptional regulator [Bradyrhizobium]MBR0815944.1 winged helix-turn-helix transcriptional regulator [Bradyrhizobium diazoefficiens]WOH71417.1 MarR family winged helix-turn-helix transcriptional regulator [Bradyrhizobium sp. NDS-1]
MARRSIAMSDFPQNCTCSQLRRAARRISRYYDLCLAGTGLKSTQYSLLGFLASEGPMTMASLANIMTMDRATVGHNLRPLERDGLLKIEVSEEDRRVREVAITDRGQEMLLAAYPAWQKARAGFETAFGVREAGHLRELMKRVIDAPLPKVRSEQAATSGRGGRRKLR